MYYGSEAKFFIAVEVNRWRDLFPAEEYEDICDCVYSKYSSAHEEPDIYELVQAELKERGYKK
jgi:hypothetical protein